jgi:hypothetical protein
VSEHELKTWPPFYEAVAIGAKTFELRRDDRAYVVGDTLVLREWEPVTDAYTGRWVRVRVTYLVRDAARFGLMPGFVVLGIERVPA